MARSIVPRNELQQSPDVNVDENVNELFVRDGIPVRFWFAGHLPHNHVQRLSELVEDYGGIVRSQEDGSDVIVTSENHKDVYIRKYWSHPNVYVEVPSFVKDCIEKRKYEHAAPAKKGMGGQPMGRRNRTEFTAEDRQHLCDFLARVIPDKLTGGRTGNVIYQRLVDDARQYGQEHINSWATRHTWQSWREHYRKNQTELDPIIDTIAKRYPAVHRGQYELDRRASHRKRVFHEVFDEEEEEEDLADNRNIGNVGAQQRIEDVPRYEEEEVEEGMRSKGAEEEEEAPDGWEEEERGPAPREQDSPAADLAPPIILSDSDWDNDGDPMWKVQRAEPDDKGEEDYYSPGPSVRDSPPSPPRAPQSVSEKLTQTRQSRAYVGMPPPARFALSQTTLVNPTQSGRTQVSDGQPGDNDIPEDLEPISERIVAPPVKPKKRRRIQAISPPAGMENLDDPPARNTRARSRSVEPAQHTKQRERRRVDKGKHRANVVPVDEIQEEDDDEDDVSVNNMLSQAYDPEDEDPGSDDERSHQQLFPQGNSSKQASVQQTSPSVRKQRHSNGRDAESSTVTSSRNARISGSYIPPTGTKASRLRARR